MEYEYEADLKKLESNVERILENLGNTQDDRERLRMDVARLEDEKEELQDRLEKLQEEKKAILKRVSDLLSSIEKWEKAAGENVSAAEAPISAVAGGKATNDPVQGVLVGN